MNLLQQVVSRIVGLDREVEKRVDEEKRGWETVVLENFRGNTSSAGSSVTPGSSLQLSAVYASIRLMSETLAGLPLPFYEWQDEGRRRAPEFYLYDLLNVQPNPQMTAFEYREALQAYMMRWGNAYSKIVYSQNAYDGGQIKELWPMIPENILQTRMDRGIKYYQYQEKDGKVNWYPETQIWHMKGLGDGENGYNPTTLMRRALGLGLSAEEFGAKFFENDAILGLVFEHPGKMGDTAYQRLKDDISAEHGGVKKSHRPYILEEGVKLIKSGVEPDHAQFLETRKFQVNEVARMERIPPHLIGDLDRATFSNIEQQSIEFVIYSLQPWCIRWEQSIQARLMLPAERKRYFAEHLVDGLLRGDTLSRYQAYAAAINAGWFTRADARKKENLSYIAGLEEPLVPLNMVQVNQSGAAPARGAGARADIRPWDKRADKKDELKAAKQRLYLARSFKDIFLKNEGRAIKREIKDVKEALKKIKPDNLEASIASFQSWLETYYEEFHSILMEYHEANFYALGEAIQANAADQIGSPIGLTPGLNECLDYHIDRTTLRHITTSKRVIQETVTAEKANIANGDMEAFDALFEGWIPKRAEEFAAWEVIRTANLMAKATWFYGQVKGLEWIQLDENKFCSTLDGKIIEMGSSCRDTHFVTKDDKVEAEGRSDVLKPSWNVATPPLFLGCTCMISPIKE